MLVLSRRKNEAVVINDEITVMIVEIRGDRVRLGFTAPKEVQINRQEVHDAIHAAQSQNNPLPLPARDAERSTAAATASTATQAAVV